MLDRRNFMKTCSGMGLAGTLFPGVLWAQAKAQDAAKITKEMIENAAAIADVSIAEDYKQMMLESLNDQTKGYEEIYKLHIPNSVEPARLSGLEISQEEVLAFSAHLFRIKAVSAARGNRMGGGLSRRYFVVLRSDFGGYLRVHARDRQR